MKQQFTVLLSVVQFCWNALSHLEISLVELCDILCSDAKTDIKNDDGKIPIEVAELNEQEAAVKALKEGKPATPKSDNSEKKSSVKKETSSSQDSKQDVYL